MSSTFPIAPGSLVYITGGTYKGLTAIFERAVRVKGHIFLPSTGKRTSVKLAFLSTTPPTTSPPTPPPSAAPQTSPQGPTSASPAATPSHQGSPVVVVIPDSLDTALQDLCDALELTHVTSPVAFRDYVLSRIAASLPP